MGEKIINAFCFTLRAIMTVITLLVVITVVILFLPFILIVKLFESRRPRNTLWL